MRSNLFWGLVLIFIITPLLVFFLLVTPELIKEDITNGMSELKSYNIFKGLFLLTRPIWGPGIIVLIIIFDRISHTLIDRWLERVR